MSSPNIADRKLSSSWDRNLVAVNKILAPLQRQVHDQHDKLNLIIQLLVGITSQTAALQLHTVRQTAVTRDLVPSSIMIMTQQALSSPTENQMLSTRKWLLSNEKSMTSTTN
ncbi:MAG: hypothetical protein AB2693_04995 [Candidatus Thiodiazotropha sp.]